MVTKFRRFLGTGTKWGCVKMVNPTKFIIQVVSITWYAIYYNNCNCKIIMLHQENIKYNSIVHKIKKKSQDLLVE